MSKRSIIDLAAIVLAAALCSPAHAELPPVILNEVMYNPPSSLGPDEELEYIELHNRSALPADLSGYRLKDSAIDHTFRFPAGASIPAGGFLVVARNLARLRGAYGNGFAAVGDLPFPLGNGNDTVRLLSATALVDQVEYDDDPPWPAAADGEGSSLERIDPARETSGFEDFAASARSSPPGTPGASNSRRGALPRRHDVVLNEIMYNPVKNPAADPLRHCEGEEFLELHNRGSTDVDLSRWTFTRGIDFTFPAGTAIPAGGYLVLYHDRAMFEAKYGPRPNALGPYLLVQADGGEDLVLADSRGEPADSVEYDDSEPWPVNPDGLRGSLELADPFEDNARGRAWRESADFKGTPGEENSARAALLAAGGNQGPRLTRPEHHPPGEPLAVEISPSSPARITVRAADPDGVAQVTLLYQAMAAGSYITMDDPRFDTEWVEAPMAYSPDDGVYEVLVPPQPNRSLVRYRFLARDGATPLAGSVAPYADDPEPNHAYFVYDGLPPYVAGVRSEFGAPGHEHRGLDLLPVYHLIADGADIFEAQYVARSVTDNAFRWRASLVFQGRVHDHLGLRLRGGVHRYHWPKRSWKVRFNKGNLFRGVLNDESPFPHAISRMNLIAEQHNDGRPRGESGVFESLAWKLFAEAGVVASWTSFVHLRIIDDPEELDQYRGDFQGIFLDVERLDDEALSRNGRPVDERASLYRFSDVGREKERSDCTADDADVRAFINGYTVNNTPQWYRDNFDVDRYLSLRTVVELSHHYDMGSKNYYYYFNTDSSLWEMLPWDLDNTFGSDSGDGSEPFRDRVIPRFRVEYQGRFRFLWQTIYDQARMNRTIDLWAARISGVADADMDRWNREPYCDCAVDRDPPNCGSQGNQCGFYGKFAARMTALKAWINARRTAVAGASIGNVNDAAKPATPVNSSPANGATVSLLPVLSAGPYTDPQGDAHAGSHWLVASREDPEWTAPVWEWVDPAGGRTARVPPDVLVEDAEYLFRVRYRDATGRWSLLSEPTYFTTILDLTPPSVPGGLSAVIAGPRTVSLSWSPSADPETGIFGYRVERDGDSITPSPVSTAAFDDRSAVPGSSHRYQVVAVNGAGLESPSSGPAVVDMPALSEVFVRGDANQDGSVDISDPISILFHLFAGGSVACADAADADDSGVEDLSDGLRLLIHLFRDGAAPLPPYPACGKDLTDDDLPACEGVTCGG